MEQKKKFILTVNREFGTGGRAIAREAARRLGVKILDKSYLEEVRREFNLTFNEMEKIKARKTSWWDDVCRFYGRFETGQGVASLPQEETVTSQRIFAVETQVLRNFAEYESCVIVGRSACHVFRDDPAAMRVFLTASHPVRVRHIMEKLDVDEDEACRLIEKYDKTRETYSKNFSGKTRYDLRDYDLAVNIDHLTFEQSVRMLINLVEFRNNI